MARNVSFESQNRRMDNILKVLKGYGINSIEEAEEICSANVIDPYLICEQTQAICFDNPK